MHDSDDTHAHKKHNLEPVHMVEMPPWKDATSLSDLVGALSSHAESTLDRWVLVFPVGPSLPAVYLTTIESWAARRSASSDSFFPLIALSSKEDRETPDSAHGVAQSYLKLMVYRVLSLAGHPVENGSSHSQVPLTPISDESVIHALVTDLEAIFASVVGVGGTSATRSARFVFEEIASNIVAHSRDGVSGFGSAFLDAATDRLEIAFADCGIGILQSLQEDAELARTIETDKEAIELAVRRRISSKSDSRRHSGVGLTQLLRMADDLQGEAHVYSGDAHLTHRDETTIVRDSLPHWRGTIVWVSVPLGIDEIPARSLWTQPPAGQ